MSAGRRVVQAGGGEGVKVRCFKIELYMVLTAHLPPTSDQPPDRLPISPRSKAPQPPILHQPCAPCAAPSPALLSTGGCQALAPPPGPPVTLNQSLTTYSPAPPSTLRRTFSCAALDSRVSGTGTPDRPPSNSQSKPLHLLPSPSINPVPHLLLRCSRQQGVRHRHERLHGALLLYRVVADVGDGLPLLRADLRCTGTGHRCHSKGGGEPGR